MDQEYYIDVIHLLAGYSHRYVINISASSIISAFCLIVINSYGIIFESFKQNLLFLKVLLELWTSYLPFLQELILVIILPSNTRFNVDISRNYLFIDSVFVVCAQMVLQSFYFLILRNQFQPFILTRLYNILKSWNILQYGTTNRILKSINCCFLNRIAYIQF